MATAPTEINSLRDNNTLARARHKEEAGGFRSTPPPTPDPEALEQPPSGLCLRSNPACGPGRWRWSLHSPVTQARGRRVGGQPGGAEDETGQE